jgi:hypothetical protein
MGQTVVDPEKKVWEDRFVFSWHILACLTILKVFIKRLGILRLS